MSEARLQSGIWVSALNKRAGLGGAFVMVLHKGDGQRGAVLVKTLDGARQARVLGAVFAMDGPQRFGVRVQGDEAGADAYIARALERDSDLWVIEISDRDGRHFLTEEVEG